MKPNIIELDLNKLPVVIKFTGKNKKKEYIIQADKKQNGIYLNVNK